MATAAFAVSLVAVLIALASVVFTWRADRRAQRAEPREVRRHELEEAEAAERRRGRPIFVPKGVQGGPTAERVHHMYQARNAGQATITGLWLWSADGAGKTVSSVAGGERLVLAPGEGGVLMGVDVSHPLPESQTLMVRWIDPDGEHTESTGIHPPRYA